MSSFILARVNATLLKHLTDVCTIQQNKPLIGSYGESVEAFDTLYAAVPCRVIRAGFGNSTKLIGLQPATEETYRLIIPASYNLEAYRLSAYRVQWNGDDYDVAGIRDGLSDKMFSEFYLTRRRS